jgi:hypothetical protein
MILRDNAGINLNSSEVRKNFPAIFNHRPSDKVSDKYQLYRSDELIEKLGDKGMKLVELGIETARKRDPKTATHVMRFQPTEAPLQFGVNDSIPELVIANNHSGRARFTACGGIFRFVCANGMIVPMVSLGAVQKRHFGESNTFDKVAQLVEEMPEAILKMHSRILDWSALQLDESEQTALAMQLVEERHGPEWLTSDLALTARRESEKPVDGVRDMWTTFNVLQENLTNVEIHNASREDNRSRMRPISSGWTSFRTNASLWSTAEAYYEASVEGMSETEKDALKQSRENAYKRNWRAVNKAKETATTEVADAVDA